MRTEGYVPISMGLVAILFSKHLARTFAHREARLLSRDPADVRIGRIRAAYVAFGVLLVLVGLLVGFPDF
jgi:hypothetical protein